VVITRHGEPKAVLQDISTYEKAQETLALLKALALTGKQIEEGRISSVTAAFERVRERVKA
jgi:PHD/YefM family antitoxin component YafN of YafNO toxin-antitoxin module